ncbi:hypothetical protein L1987_06801 [Smallanthus sonchifolius]|uniref:Uncharacterized protein n=1 Tax=Smallanthus sonchifolius TaxID=185202 RepID=A0ACB9JZI1_9ASTR|nr:hypothetical protein L1987_06801 [Smallanthus sonchifolius]
MREEWTEALISLGEDSYYLEKLSNKEIYRAFMGQQGKLATKKRAKEEEKARQKSKKNHCLQFFRGRAKLKRSIYRSVDEVMQLLDSDLQRMMELGEAHEPESDRGRHLLLHQTFDAADRQIISSFDFATDTSAVTLTHLSAEGMLLMQMKKDNTPILIYPAMISDKTLVLLLSFQCRTLFTAVVF